MYAPYQDLYKKADEWCINHLKNQDLIYYLQTFD